jgi:hypothetical protein
MEHKASKVFVAGENRVYFGELPAHLAKKGLPKNVARTELFRLEGRDGNTLIFKSGKLYATTYIAKALQNPKTGAEICFVEYNGTRVMLEASKYMHGGRKVSKETLDSAFTADGRTLRQNLADEAAKPLDER